jgi:hypothetical protein
LIGEIERSIGGGMFDQTGRLTSSTMRIRDLIPDKAVEEEKEKLRRGIQQSLV